MRRLYTKGLPISLVIGFIFILISSCVPKPAFEEIPPDPTPLLPTLGIPPTATYTPAPTATPEPISLFLSEEIPFGVIDLEDLNGINLSTNPDAALWFGLDIDAPSGEVLQTATWVYALAAPFPTLLDNISLNELKGYWLGMLVGRLEEVTHLYVPELLIHMLTSHWGVPNESRVQSFQQTPEIELLWEENAWVILPFEALDHQLKVIQVEERSPLFKDFDIEDYPLVARFQLVQQIGTGTLSADALESLRLAIQPGNRDPEKMTTLVMTGVTALVRATAYRMEIHGVTYPGEKIRHWLSEADLTHISNEVSFYQDCPFPDPADQKLLFCCDPKYIELLEYIGADIIELTGNHNNDAIIVHGVDVVPFTLDLYDERRMGYFGGGRDLAEAKTPLQITHNGNKLAFIGCNAFGPDFAWASETSGGSAPCEDFKWMADEVRWLRNEGYLPIATFQYYEDYYDFAAAHHVRDYGIMAEAGAVVVNGSQAHRPKAMAFNQDAFIHYGLGNLFFDQNWYIDMYGNVIVQTSWEIIQRHTFYAGKHLSVELLTAKLVDYAQPQPMTGDERVIFLTELFEASGWVVR